MESPRQGVFPPVLAGLVTGLLTWAIVGLPEEWDPTGGSVGWMVPLLLVFPFLVSALWGWALLAGRPKKVVAAAAGGLLAVALMWWPQDIVWQVAGNVAAGMAAGLALGSRWRIDAGLAAVTVCLAPVLIWSALQVPLRENMTAFQDSTLQSMEESLWSKLDEPQRTQARLREEARLEDAIEMMARIFPALLAVGVLGQAGLILLLVLWLGRRTGLATGLGGGRQFTGWRFPFYLVWALALGVGLMLTRQPALGTAGLNLALVAASLIGVQGLAVQAFFTARLLPGPMQVVFWLVMGLPLAGVLMVASVVLGLADQWIDMRRRYLARGIE